MNRIWVISFFYLFTGTSILLTHYLSTKSLARTHLALIFALVLLENTTFLGNFYSFDTNVIKHNTELVIEELSKNACEAFYLKDNTSSERNAPSALNGVWASIATNTPTVNGYTGVNPYDSPDSLALEKVTEILANTPLNRFCYILGNYEGYKIVKVTTQVLTTGK